jgi:hypothetical protein
MTKATKLTPGQAWALVVFGNVRAGDVVSPRGRFVYEGAPPLYSIDDSDGAGRGL